MASHHKQQASKCNGAQQHWPAYNAKLAPPQASTERLFQQTQALAQACAFPSPKSKSMSVIAILRQLPPSCPSWKSEQFCTVWKRQMSDHGGDVVVQGSGH